MNKYLWIAALSLFSSTALASNLGQFDARSMALGGTGVASASSANAAAHNPALLSTDNNDKSFNVIPLAIGVDAFDEDDFVDKVETAEDAIDALNDSIDALGTLTEETCTTGAGTIPCFKVTSGSEIAAQAQNLNDVVTSLNTSAARVNINTGIAFSLGNKVRPVAIILDGGVSMKVGLKVADRDFDELLAYADTLDEDQIDLLEVSELVAQDLASYQNNELEFNRGDDASSTELSSFVEVIGAVYKEVGISFSDLFKYMGTDLAIGVTPKIVTVQAVKFHQGVEEEDDALDADDILDDEYIKEKSDFNVDVGVAFKPLSTQPLQVGVVVKNLFSRTYELKKTSLENNLSSRGFTPEEISALNITQSLKIEPQVTAGVSYNPIKVIRLAADLDLNEAELLGRTSQYLALGAELDLRILKLEAGYQSAIGGDDEDDAVSAGFSLGPAHFAAISAGDRVGGVFQIAFGF